LQNFLQLIRLGIKNQKIFWITLQNRVTHSLKDFKRNKQFINSLWLQNYWNKIWFDKVIFVELACSLIRMFCFMMFERRMIWTNVFYHLFWILYDL
jgi:hypothetical protein